MILMHKMMAVALVLLAGMFAALPAQAEDDKAAQEAAREKERRVKEYCSLMTRINKDIDGKHADAPTDDVTHVPDADVTYGGDVSGVTTGADMMQMALPEKIEIPVTLDMLGYAGVDAPQGVMGEAKLAQVDVYLDGRILYNGKDISGNFHDLCAEAEASDTDKDKKNAE